MKKYLLVTLVCLFLCGCTNSTTSSDPYLQYTDAMEKMKSVESYTNAFSSAMKVTLGTYGTFDYTTDSSLQLMNASENPTAYVHVEAKMDEEDLSYQAYYENHVFYLDTGDTKSKQEIDLKDTAVTNGAMLESVPVIEKDSIESIKTKKNSTDTEIEIILKKEAVLDIFLRYFDTQGVSDLGTPEIDSNSLVLTINEEGYITKQVDTFSMHMNLSDIDSTIEVVNTAVTTDINATVVKAPETILSTLDQFKEVVDVVMHSEDEDSTNVETNVETFQNRLVETLGYEINSDGLYFTGYNTNEAYYIDFKNKLFTYQKGNAAYVYNWKSDASTYGTCTYSYATEEIIGTCSDDILTNVKKVKDYMKMELNFCDMTLEELLSEK